MIFSAYVNMIKKLISLVVTFQDCPPDQQPCLVSVHRTQHCRSHASSDHNYYAVCRSILSSHALIHGRDGPAGLLHDVPADVNELYDLTELVEQCAQPSKLRDRARTVIRLFKALTDIVRPKRRVVRN